MDSLRATLMEIKKTHIEGLVEILPSIYGDDRGHFLELHNKKIFDDHDINANFVQDNCSFSHKGVVRGIHLQYPPHQQAKFVRVLKGKVLDIALDLRPDSATFGQSHALVLTSDDYNALYIPEGFGHGFAALEDSTFIYTDPPSCLGFWIALEDATLENGCLMAIPGSQQSDLGSLRFVRNAQGTETFFVGEPGPAGDLDQMVPLEVESGSLIILHGALIHMSTPNCSSHSRHAYVLHLVDAQAHWSTDNWLQRPDNIPFRRLNQYI